MRRVAASLPPFSFELHAPVERVKMPGIDTAQWYLSAEYDLFPIEKDYFVVSTRPKWYFLSMWTAKIEDLEIPI